MCSLIMVIMFWQNDGMHFRQPWVTGMQQEVERFKKIFNEQEKLKRECEALKVSGNINCNMFVPVCNATCVTKRLVCLIYVQEQVKMMHLRLNELESSHSKNIVFANYLFRATPFA
ncbi:hypothetical protein YC2023_022744 [Brassica napus]